MKKRVVVALGHRALGTTLPEQKVAVKSTAKCIADLIEAGYQVAITHSNAPQVGMIHTALNEFAKNHPENAKLQKLYKQPVSVTVTVKSKSFSSVS